MFLVAGSLTAFLILSRPKTKKSGLFAAKSKKPKNDAAVVHSALKRLEKYPQDTDALLTVGERYYNQQDWDRAYKTYQSLCNSPNGRPGVDYFEIHFRCGLAAARLGMSNEAYKNFIVAASFKESDYRVQFELGNLYFQNGSYEKAVSCLTKSRSLNPEYAPAFCVLGHTYFKLKKYKDAMINIRKALDITPGDKETLFTLAECYEESGQTDQAVRIYSHLRADPKWGPESCLAAGNIHAKARRLDEAVTDYEIGLKHKAAKLGIVCELRYQLAMTHVKKSDFDKALTHLNMINEEKPGYKNTEKLISQYSEVYQNRNLQIYIMSQPDEFLGLCRRMIFSFYAKAKVKILQTNVVGNEWADILAQIDTPRWSHIIGFRFFRSQGNIGELVIRDFHEHLKSVKADKGICFTAGQYSNEAKRFTEVRLIELIDRPHLLAHLAGTD
ncbi:MAG: tetratricopeptide repeat protein [Spirochaetaceae bacterium]|jgi:tetratricopeptide (TPR) repeat protein|nr:tetratricopeptide repeat protein [Spirochaetaceae bacterium]